MKNYSVENMQAIEVELKRIYANDNKEGRVIVDSILEKVLLILKKLNNILSKKS